MKNRLITPPAEQSIALNKSFDLSTLKGKFAAKVLFRSCYYDLITGKLSVLDNVPGRWLAEQIVEYARVNHDVNLIPALKKIADDPKYNESIRQRSSEVTEIIEDQYHAGKTTDNHLGIKSEEEKVINARILFSGERYPQTSEVLRLLRDKSPELKRLALYLINKFRMSDLLLEVCECLNIQGLEGDAFFVLQSFGSEAGNELRRFYLASSGNINTSKTILRILGKTCTKENSEFLFSRIWSNSRKIKETAIGFLVDCNFKAPDNESDRLKKLIYDTFGLLTWIISAKVCLDKNIDTLLFREMDNEFIRWKAFLFNLLYIMPGSQTPARSANEGGRKEDDNSGIIRKMVEIVFFDSQKPKFDMLNDFGSDKKILTKLIRYFPVEIPKYKELLEDLINRDYNLINIWTKVCTLRNLAEIDDEDLAESVVALLFSPEEILQEEAARLIARSGKELYWLASERIPEQTRQRLDKIISGEAGEGELLTEKVRFLKSCFSEIQEEDLLCLAVKLLFITNLKDEIASLQGGNILWLMSEENPIPMVYVVHEGTDLKIKGFNLKTHGTFAYILPFSTIEEFHFQYPERSYEIFKYIDNNEE